MEMTIEQANKVLEMFLHKQCSLSRTEFAYSQNEIWAAVKMASEALEKQIPKKPNITLRGTTGWNTEAYCPVCKTMVHSSYCSGCGQAIKWGD